MTYGDYLHIILYSVLILPANHCFVSILTANNILRQYFLPIIKHSKQNNYFGSAFTTSIRLHTKTLQISEILPSLNIKNIYEGDYLRQICILSSWDGGYKYEALGDKFIEGGELLLM